MGKENIRFVTLWIILGNTIATFSTTPGATTVFGKTRRPVWREVMMVMVMMMILVVMMMMMLINDRE